MLQRNSSQLLAKAAVRRIESHTTAAAASPEKTPHRGAREHTAYEALGIPLEEALWGAVREQQARAWPRYELASTKSKLVVRRGAGGERAKRSSNTKRLVMWLTEQRADGEDPGSHAANYGCQSDEVKLGRPPTRPLRDGAHALARLLAGHGQSVYAGSY